MITYENTRKIYDSVIVGVPLTTKELNSYGLNSKDINNLIEQGIIERVKRGYYSLKSINNLFNYGKELVTRKKYEEAFLCFKKCFELDPNHLGACFQLFIKSIQQKDYDQAFKLFDHLLNSNNKYYLIDANYYLFLLSIITDVPEKYRDFVKSIKIDDIKVDNMDKRYLDIELQNKIRIASLERKFSYAYRQLMNLVKKHNKLTIQDFITKILLQQAMEAEKVSKEEIIKLIKEKKYEDLVTYLEVKKYYQSLSLFEEYTLLLAQRLIEISTTLKIPKSKISKTKFVFNAIDNQDYFSALRLSIEYNQNYKIENESNAIYLLLSDICTLIKRLSMQEPQKQEPIKKDISNNETNIITVILSYLTNNDTNNAFLTLKKYLESIHQDDYYDFIKDLIKLSIFQGLSFDMPLTVLISISNGNFKLETSSYIQKFYISLSNNNFEEARIYLDIIADLSKIEHNSTIVEELLRVLESAKQVGLAIKKDSKIDTDKPKIDSSKIITKEEEYIENKYKELLKDKGIVLLKPMSFEHAKRMVELAEYYPDVETFTISIKDKKQVVLKYNAIDGEHADIRNLINFGRQAYKYGDYDECINNFTVAIQYLKKPKAFIFAYIGLSLMKKGNIKSAINYLTVATCLSSEEDYSINFEGLIAKLQGKNIGKTSEVETKPFVKMSLNDFDSMDSYYGINNFNEIKEYILLSDLDIDSACSELGLSLEQINIVKLLFARDHYKQEEYEKGDTLILSVEKSKNKNPLINQIIQELRVNKKFYKNRKETAPKGSAFTIKPIDK